jgi:predicted phage terminase large subunit-like protein
MRDIAPQPGPQEAFLASSADVVFFGGAAGGGKTYALLLEPLRHITTTKGFGAVFFRRESPQITTEGGPWDTAVSLYTPLGAKNRQSPNLDFKFPPYNNTISFSHMQHEKSKENWLGAQIPLMLFDQLETFTRSQILYMFSRSRSTCGVAPYIRGSYNPVPADDEVGGWLHEFVGWYLDENGEYPDLSKAGVIRWFVNVRDRLHWYDSKAAALAAWPDIPPLSFTFIPSFVEDNQILLKADPTYLAKLHGLNLVEQERLLRGNHKIRPEAGKVVNRSWLYVVDQLPPIVEIVRFWDFAATEKKRKMGAATASIKMCKDANGGYGILDMTEDWIGPAEVDDHAVAIALQDGRVVRQRWEEEGGSSGKRTTSALAKKMAGLNCAGVRPTGDKLDRFRPFASQVQARNVWLLRADWNDRLLSILHNTPDGLWDVRDCCSGSFEELSGPRKAGTFASGKSKGWQPTLTR